MSELVPAEAEATPEHRVTDAAREQAAQSLGRAQRDGRFGSSDLYERRMAKLPGAFHQRDLDDLVGDLGDLVPDRVRDGMLRAVARAHADGRLDFAEFSRRSERCLEPVTRVEADELVHDLGYRVALPLPRRRAGGAWAGPVRRVLTTGVAGGALGAGLVAVPAGLDLPGGISVWLPLAVGTGVFTGIGTAVATVAWLVRRPVRRLPGRPSTLGERGVEVSGRLASPARARHMPAARLGGGDR